MRWPISQSTRDPCQPHLWYAWKPVQVGDEWVWLEYVWRKWNHAWWEDYYTYGNTSTEL